MYAIQQEDILLTHTRGLTHSTKSLKLHCMRNEAYVHPTWPWSLMINFCSLCCAAAVSEGGFCKYPWTVFSARERIIGYRQDTTIMSGDRQDTTIMSGYRQDITIMSGYRQDITMSGYRQDIMPGYHTNVRILK